MCQATYRRWQLILDRKVITCSLNLNFSYLLSMGIKLYNPCLSYNITHCSWEEFYILFLIKYLNKGILVKGLFSGECLLHMSHERYLWTAILQLLNHYGFHCKYPSLLWLWHDFPHFLSSTPTSLENHQFSQWTY